MKSTQLTNTAIMWSQHGCIHEGGPTLCRIKSCF